MPRNPKIISKTPLVPIPPGKISRCHTRDQCVYADREVGRAEFISDPSQTAEEDMAGAEKTVNPGRRASHSYDNMGSLITYLVVEMM